MSAKEQKVDDRISIIDLHGVALRPLGELDSPGLTPGLSAACGHPACANPTSNANESTNDDVAENILRNAWATATESMDPASRRGRARRRAVPSPPEFTLFETPWQRCGVNRADHSRGAYLGPPFPVGSLKRDRRLPLYSNIYTPFRIFF